MSELQVPASTVPEQVPGIITLPVESVMDPTIQALMNQALAKSHETWLATQDRAAAGDANVAEQTRIAYLIDRANLALAGDILAQRSSQSQPQQGGTVINPGSVAAGS